LIIFGRSPHQGLDVLRALRAGELAPGVSGVRVLWMGTSRKTRRRETGFPGSPEPDSFIATTSSFSRRPLPGAQSNWRLQTDDREVITTPQGEVTTTQAR
jgi:hypothetical protein